MNQASVVEQAFMTCFGHAAAHLVRAPGRVNLIGEHTDYNGGFVLPCAIDLGTWVAASPRNDNEVRVVALDMGREVVMFPVASTIAYDTQHPWSNYVRGVVQIFAERGWLHTGANLVISGNIPQGTGLSSSASLEVAV
ncbi:MAG: galactokinase family protein, partial [Myxococcota bacterium]|nr:galactokinase family protein [Myxococcota bacterium]